METQLWSFLKFLEFKITPRSQYAFVLYKEDKKSNIWSDMAERMDWCIGF